MCQCLKPADYATTKRRAMHAMPTHPAAARLQLSLMSKSLHPHLLPVICVNGERDLVDDFDGIIQRTHITPAPTAGKKQQRVSSTCLHAALAYRVAHAATRLESAQLAWLCWAYITLLTQPPSERAMRHLHH